MVEMIASKRIGRPEELETLLACYLSLNADEHHDCIVKVFRQVWFELNPARGAASAPAPRS
uniref:Transcription repressor n=2 Tax=Oryza brachyantha TaxID=4533 RepID=J3L426_ORYBR